MADAHEWVKYCAGSAFAGPGSAMMTLAEAPGDKRDGEPGVATGLEDDPQLRHTRPVPEKLLPLPEVVGWLIARHHQLV